MTVFVLVQSSCGSKSDGTDPNNPQPPDDPPCSCDTGARRCIGNSVQVCEQDSPTCSSWGALVACPSGSCGDGACQGDCQDACPAGTSRCGADGGRDICRVGGSGCLEWVKQDCAAGQYCDQTQSTCVPVVACDTACPKGYSCRPDGVCAGGTATDLVLNVPTVKVAGSVTLNGVAPKNGSACSDTMNPDYAKASVHFYEKSHGYQVEAQMYCRDKDYAFSVPMFPGTYSVTVTGAGSTDITDLPGPSYVADSSFVVTVDASGKVFDVKTLTGSGRLTLNGVTPANGSFCSSGSNPDYQKATVQFYETTNGYNFQAPMYCRDATYAFTTPLYPGTYSVTVQGSGGANITNLPTQGYVVDGKLVVSSSFSGKVYDVKTVTANGRVTMNGAAPQNGSFCSAGTNPDYQKATVQFYETTNGYSFQAPMYCRDASYQWTTPLYPGTYSVTVIGNGGDQITNLPGQSYIVDPKLVVAADVSGKVFNVQSITISGGVTLNGAAPQNGTFCSAATNPDYQKATVQFYETTSGYSFQAPMYCRDTTYKWTTPLYPGTYRVSVSGNGDTNISNLPGQGYVADGKLVVTADTSGKVFDVKSIMFAGSVTLNGSPPTNGSFCSATDNPDFRKANVSLYETTYGYNFSADMYCRDSGYQFTTPLYPGTYRVQVSGQGSSDITSLPQAGYIADGKLMVAADTSGKVFDVKTVAVGGRVTLNDLVPQNGDACSATMNPDFNKAHITFYENTNGYSFDADMYCRDPGYQFTAVVYPGIYQIAVNGQGGPDITNLPNDFYVPVGRLQIP